MPERMPRTLATYRELAAQGRLGVRLYVMLKGEPLLRTFTRPEVGLHGGFLTIRAVKLIGDGALGSRGAALLEPYLDDPGNSGHMVTPPETILSTARYAHRPRLPGLRARDRRPGQPAGAGQLRGRHGRVFRRSRIRASGSSTRRPWTRRTSRASPSWG
jgi:hypothetical protein